MERSFSEQEQLKLLIRDVDTIRKNSQAQARMAAFTTGLTIVCMVLITVAALYGFPKIYSSLNTFNSAMTELKEVSSALNSLELDTLVSSVTTLASDGSDAIDQALIDVDVAIEKIGTAVELLGKLDVESLNKNISNLTKVLDPLAKFFTK